MNIRRFISAVWKVMTTATEVHYDLVMLIIVAIVGLEMAILFLFEYAAFLLFAPVMGNFTLIVYVCYLSIDLWRRRNEI